MDKSTQEWADAMVTEPDYVTMVTYTADGVSDQYEFNFPGGYLSRNDIKAYMVDEIAGTRTDLTVTFVAANMVKLAPLQPNGVKVTIFRDTPKELPLINFTDGAMIEARNLDRNAKQCIFAIAELLDRYNIVYQQVELAQLFAEAAQAAATQAAAQAAFVQSIYERFKLTDELIAEINNAVNQSNAYAGLAQQGAARAESAANRAELAANVAVGLGLLYSNQAEMAAAIAAGKIPDDGVAYILSSTDQTFAYPYRNKAGVIVPVLDPNGVHKGTLSSQYAKVTRDLAEATDMRTAGLHHYVDGEGKVWVDDRGRALMAILKNGDKQFYGNSFSDLLEIITKMVIGNTEFLLGNDSPYIWGITDEKNRVIFGLRRSDLKLLYMGEELNGGSDPGPGPDPVLPPVKSLARAINTVFYLGDSITANGVSNNNTLNALSWPAVADLLTDGVIQYDGQGATGGMRIDQILDTWLPAALERKSKFCVLHMGRNDVFQGWDIAGKSIPAFNSIVAQLIKAEITPVICTMSAQGQTGSPIPASQEIRRNQLNAHYRAVARKYELPLVDMMRWTTNPLTGGWWDGWSQDVSHPTKIGARGMAEALVKGLLDWLQPTPPRAAEMISTPDTSDNKLVNPLFIDHSGWAGTYTVEPRDGFKGNVIVLPPGGQIITQNVDLIKGRNYGFSFRVESPDASQFAAYINYTGQTDNFAGLRSFNGTIERPMTFYRENTALYDKATVMFANQGTGNVYIGQAGLFLLPDLKDA